MPYQLELREKINEFLFENSEISSNDPLKNVFVNGVYPITTNGQLNNEEFNFLFKHYKQLYSDTGINPVCVTNFAIKINQDRVWTPVLLQETTFSKKEKSFEPYGDFFLNPYLKNKLKIGDDLSYNNLAPILEFLTINSISFELADESYIGLFHPYRFELIKELMELKEVEEYSIDLANILNLEPSIKNDHVFHWSNSSLFSNNSYQINALDFLKNQSILVKGPPGTGKSQMIASLIGKCLYNEHSAIFVSEKKSAIDAVYTKLRKFKLNKFVLTFHGGKFKRKKTIEDLKSTWDYLQDLNSSPPIVSNDIEIERSEELFFKQLFDVNKLVELKLLTRTLENGIHLNYNLHNSVEIDYKELSYFLRNSTSFSQNDFKIVQKLNLDEYDQLSFNKLIVKLESLYNQINKLKVVESLRDVNNLVLLSLKIRKYQSHYYVKYASILSSNKSNFKKLYLRWSILNSELKNFKRVFTHWKKIPNDSEIQNLYSVFNKIKYFKSYRIKKHLKEFTDIEPSIAFGELNQITKLHNTQKKLFQLEKSFQKLHIYDLNDLGIINELMDTFKLEDWDFYNSLSVEEIDYYFDAQPIIHSFNSLLEKHFKLLPNDNIKNVLNLIKSHEGSIANLKSYYNSLSKELMDLLSKCSCFDELNFNLTHSYLKSRWKLSDLPTKNTLELKLKSIYNKLNLDEVDSEKNANKITAKILQKFNWYQKIVITANKELNQEEGLLKKKLKAGKKILVHEFSKKRNFKSIRELMQTDAKYWITITNPIMMLNPFQLSSFSPMKNDLFSIGIIDEASQMPISHALGTIQRCKRMLIAGDENQIEPLSFFKNNSKNEPSILHQGKYHLPQFQLRYHYRSESESLINYSNKYFYQNKLQIIENRHALEDECIFDHYVKRGIFDGNKNNNEAEELAVFFLDFIKKKFSSGLSFAIIAFSQAQLNQIILEISKKNSGIIERLENQNRILLKTLDQVQGEEADIVFISFGYAKNRENKFEMRFGPVNLSGGDKRLNVLFSRSKKQIHFFSSVRLNEFKKSDNIGVIALKNWFDYIENQYPKDFLIRKKSKAKISFFQLLNDSSTSVDLIHMLKTYYRRGWSFTFD